MAIRSSSGVGCSTRCVTRIRRFGAKAVVRAQAADVVDVEVDDPGVLHDIDEPGDYARVFEQPI